MTARERVLEALTRAGCRVSNGGSASTCPAHEDHAPSLSIGTRRDGDGVLLNCHAGCPPAAVLDALGLTERDLFDEPRTSTRPEVVATYPYVDEQGQLLYEKVRYQPKDFRQRRPDGRGGWTWRLDDARRVLYRLPEVLAAVADGRPVFVAEGERDADNLTRAGATATTWTEGAWKPGQAPKWRREYVETLAGAHVVIVRDRDDAGRHTAGTIAGMLSGVAATVAVVEPAEGKDLTDHLQAGRALDELVPVEPVSGVSSETPDPTVDLDDETEAALAFNRDVADELRRLRVRKAAQDRLRAEDRPVAPPFDAGMLGELLARPAGPPDRVQGLIPADAGTLVPAQRKTGKTTLSLNTARCFITGEPLLGRFDVDPVDGCVSILNYEVSGDTLARWADEVGVPRDRFYIVNLRGRRNPFSDPEDLARLAKRLREVGTESLLVDPFGRAYSGTSQNDAGEVGAWLARLDEFTRTDVGARDLILTAHAGWNGERTRGSSALEDWADSVITLTRDPDDDTKRFLRAMGRDVEVDEDALTFDPATRLLTLAGTGSRKAARESAHLADVMAEVLRVVTDTPGLSGADVGRALRSDDVPFQRGDELKALRQLVAEGAVEVRPRSGRGGGKAYHRTSPNLPQTSPTGDVGTSPNLPLRSGGGSKGTSDPNLPQSTERLCPDCGRELLPGRVRCGPCGHRHLMAERIEAKS